MYVAVGYINCMNKSPDIEAKKRDRSNETFIYISPLHKQKLKAHVDKTKRTMRAETELWIDKLK